jgi:hypothetical protein
MSAPLHIGLVHYPVLDRQGGIVATSTVNYDLHDLGRAARTYGVETFYLVTPLRSQILLTERLVEHWTRGYGAGYNPSRKEALRFLRIQPSIEAVLEDVSLRSGGARPYVLATSARRLGQIVSFASVRRSLHASDRPHLVLFGTGWGLAPEAVRLANAVLAPVLGVGTYNHLSVRSAAAIVLDRLRGRHEDEEILGEEPPRAEVRPQEAPFESAYDGRHTP